MAKRSHRAKWCDPSRTAAPSIGVLALGLLFVAAPDHARAAESGRAAESARAAASARATDAVRTLEAITIEGEIPLPQVLFIASRNVPRYADEMHRRFIRTSLEVGLAATLPDRLVADRSLAGGAMNDDAASGAANGAHDSSAPRRTGAGPEE